MKFTRATGLALVLLMLAGASIAADRKVFIEHFTNAG